MPSRDEFSLDIQKAIPKLPTVVWAKSGVRWQSTKAKPLQSTGFHASIVAKSQKVDIKSKAVGHGGKSWSRYGKEYLSREGISKENERGIGFTQEGHVDLGEVMGKWEGAQDRYYYHVVMSPERSHDMDLTSHTREMMGRIEKDLGTKLEWAAIEHHNTDQPHVHLVIRGRDEEGNHIALGSYPERGMKWHAEEIATNRVGYRLTEYALERREKTLGQEKFTETDRGLWQRRDEHNRVRVEHDIGNVAEQKQSQQETERLQFLQEKGLAKQIDAGEWELYHNLGQELRFRGANREFAPEWRKERTEGQQREQTEERSRNEKQRTIRAIDDERNQGIER